MTEKDTDQKFVDAVRQAFDKSVAGIDASVLMELHRIRQRALEKRLGKYRVWIWYPAGAVVTACLAILIYNFARPATTPQSFNVDDIEMMSTTENPDLYENLEFYEWLEDYEVAG